MSATRRAAAAIDFRAMRPARSALLCLLLAGGCIAPQRTLLDSFPVGAQAMPWVLESGPWVGSFEQAAPSLGDEAAMWRELDPQRVWLAVYRHDSRPRERLTVRVFAFASRDKAGAAFDRVGEPRARELDAGHSGIWTDDGIRFVWGRLVFDMFGNRPAGAARPEQAVYLLAFIEKRLPQGLPDNPR